MPDPDQQQQLWQIENISNRKSKKNISFDADEVDAAFAMDQ